MSSLNKTGTSASQKDRLKKRILRYIREGLPVRTDTVIRLAALNPDSEMSLEDLSAIILEDIGLTAKVIQIVNSFYYRRTGHEVISVTQAVVLLGFNTIREIALGMALIDLAEKKGDDTLVSLIFSSYFGAHLAQELLANRIPSQGSEDVMVAGLFHSIARVILAFDSSEAYNELISLEKSKVKKARRFLRELGELIVTHWKLPPSISRNLEGLASDQDIVSGVIAEAHELGRGLAFNDTTQDALTGFFQRIAERTGLDENEVKDKVGIAMDMTTGLSPHFKRFLDRRSSARILMDVEPVSLPSSQVVNDKGSGDGEHQFLILFTQLSSAITGRRLSLDHVFLLATETIYRGIGVDWVILMLLTKDRKMLSPRYGLGQNVKLHKQRINIPFPPKDKVLKTAFNEGREVLVTISSLYMEMRQAMEDVDSTSKGVCAVSPIIVESKTIGCFITSMENKQTGETDLLRLKAVKDLTVMATMGR